MRRGWLLYPWDLSESVGGTSSVAFAKQLRRCLAVLFAGKVGIGIASPRGKLDVVGNAAVFDNPSGAIRITKTEGQLNSTDLGIWNYLGGGTDGFYIAGWNTGNGIFIDTATAG